MKVEVEGTSSNFNQCDMRPKVEFRASTIGLEESVVSAHLSSMASVQLDNRGNTCQPAVHLCQKNNGLSNLQLHLEDIRAFGQFYVAECVTV